MIQFVVFVIASCGLQIASAHHMKWRSFFIQVLFFISINALGINEPLFVHSLNSLTPCPRCHEIKLSCSLDNPLFNLQEVVFIGEIHTDKSSIEFKEQLLNKASEGSLQLATELVYDMGALPWLASANAGIIRYKNLDTPNIHLMESMVPYSLADSYDIQKKNLYKQDLSSLYLGFALNLSASPLFRGAHEFLREAQFDSNLIIAIDPILALIGNENSTDPFKQVSIAVAKLVKNFSEPRLRNFLTQSHRELVRIALKNYSDKLVGIELFPLLTTLDILRFGLPGDFGLEAFDPQSSYGKLIEGIRNRDFATTIGNILCTLNNNRKTLYVLVGLNHIPGIEKILSTLSHNRLTFRKVYSSKPMEAQELLKEINAL